MAKPTYKVYVVNLVTLGTRISDKRGSYYYDWDQAKLTSLISELKDLFDDVCKHGQSKFADTDVSSTDLATAGTNIKPEELLMRITTKSASILVAKYGAAAVNNDTSGATKDTGSGICSEIWLEGAIGENSISQLLARLAFHELMHNKLDATNSKDIHSKPDDGTGLAVSPVNYDTALSPQNKLNLAPKLGSVNPQFKGTSIP